MVLRHDFVVDSVSDVEGRHCCSFEPGVRSHFMARLFWVTIVLLSRPLHVSAEEHEPVRIQCPFLWEFRRADSAVTSYLFGTIHVNDPNITSLHPRVRQAFESSAAAWFEIDFINDQAVQTKAITLPAGAQLENLIPAATLARIDRRIENLSPLLSRTVLPKYRVIIWPLVLANLQAQMSQLGTQPLDVQLLIAARQAKMTTGGLEDAATQLKPLTDLSLEKQIEFLEASLDVMDADDESGVDPLKILVQLYAAGNGSDLQKYLEQEFQRPQVSADLQILFVDALLIKRNGRMVKAIKSRVNAAPDEVHFVAIGAAHLLGRDSVIEGLRMSGFTVRRVRVDDELPSASDGAKNVEPYNAARGSH
jgi:hypothetical protein